jgi:hypothetical protein
MVMRRVVVAILCCAPFLMFGLLAPAFAASPANTAAVSPATPTSTITPTSIHDAAINSTSVAQPAPIIVDNSSSAFSKTGGWTLSTQQSGYYGTNYLTDNGTGKGTMTATWSSPITTNGYYELQMMYPISTASTSTNVPVTVHYYNGQVKTFIVNEQVAGGTWVTLGSFDFTPGGGQYVEVANAGTTGTVVADAFSWTLVPAGGIPTATPLPVTTPIPGYLAKLPINYPILDQTIAAYWNSTAPPGQVALVAGSTNVVNVLASVTNTTTKYFNDTSWADAQPQLTGLMSGSHVKGFLYDAEHWPQTPLNEQNNLASTVKTASQVLHGMGLQFWMTTDPGFASTIIEPMAENVDAIILPGAHLESSPSAFKSFLVPLILQARAANPNVKIYGRVDFIHGTPQQDLLALEAIETYIDGIDIYVQDSDLTSNLPTLQALIAKN